MWDIYDHVQIAFDIAPIAIVNVILLRISWNLIKVGCLAAIFWAKRGYQVDLYEMREGKQTPISSMKITLIGCLYIIIFVLPVLTYQQ